jgi:peptide/nickel transport system permease protein
MATVEDRASHPGDLKAAVAPERRRRFAALRLAVDRIREARGVPKWILYSGAAIVALFVLLAVFAPLIAPYGIDQVSADGTRFPKQGEPSGENLFGTTVQSTDVFSRVIWGARWRSGSRWASSRATSGAASIGSWCW